MLGLGATLGLVSPLLFLGACGGGGVASQAKAEGPAAPRGAPVQAVVVQPTEAERDSSGARTVRITSREGVSTWIESPAFATSGWSEGGEARSARYRVAFEGPQGEVSVYWIGTTKSSPIKYLCFGFCSDWWVAPSLEDGSPDVERFRLMSDQVWHPLAREWYLADPGDDTHR